MTSYSKIEGLVKVNDGGRFVYWNPCCGPNTYLIVDDVVNIIEAYRTNIKLTAEVFPKYTPTFNANVYNLYVISDPEEEKREWTDLTFDNHYGFGDTTISVFVGGELGSRAILTVGETTYIKITLYNNAGYDWHMSDDAIEFIELPDKPTSFAFFYSKEFSYAIRKPVKYNFLIMTIPQYLKDYIEIEPSDHNIDVAP